MMSSANGGGATCSCPRCQGGGWIDAFDKGCKRGSLHAKVECRLCNATGRVVEHPAWRQCNGCQGKGGHGVFGPCGEHSLHFKRLCEHCQGRGYIQEPGASQVVGSRENAQTRASYAASTADSAARVEAVAPVQPAAPAASAAPVPVAFVAPVAFAAPAAPSAPSAAAPAAGFAGQQSSTLVPTTQAENDAPVLPTALAQSTAERAPDLSYTVTFLPSAQALNENVSLENQACSEQANPEDTLSLHSMLCVVCMSEPKRLMVEPCAHLCLCETCGTAGKPWHNCPICRGPVTILRTIFM